MAVSSFEWHSARRGCRTAPRRPAEHISPGVTLLVTIFDRTVADQVVKAVPNCTVIAMADAMVPALAGPCVAENFVALHRSGRTYGAVTGGRETLGVVAFPPPSAMARRAVLGKILGQLRPPDRSSRAMLSGLIGLALVLVIDVVLSVHVLHEELADAVLDAARTLAAVTGSPAVAHAPTWYKLYSAASVLATLALAAVFTAGLVNRIMSRRLTGIVGSRAVPRRGHVVVVGLGQVGLRLCIELAELGIGVVAVERDGQARNIPLARALGIPVVVGQGGDRFLLQRLSLKRARALAAVSADGLENIAVAVAALAVAPDLRIVLRAGDDDAPRSPGPCSRSALSVTSTASPAIPRGGGPRPAADRDVPRRLECVRAARRRNDSRCGGARANAGPDPLNTRRTGAAIGAPRRTSEVRRRSGTRPGRRRRACRSRRSQP